MADGEGRVGTEKNRRSTDAYYLDIIKTLEKLQSRLDSGAYLSASETEQLNSASQDFEALRTNDPQRFDRLVGFVNSVRKSTGTTGPNGQPNLSNLLNSTFTENVRRNTVSSQETNRTSRTYVDLPTPAEFLDNFNNAYNIHLTSLSQSGAIRPEVAAFSRELQQQIFGEYLAEQTRRMMAGEPLWKVVGQNAEEKQVGVREGQSEIQTSQGESKSTTSSVRNETQSGIPSVTGAGAAVELGTTSGTTNTESTEAATDILKANEIVMSRNNLAYVANLSPLDFFKDKATAQRLNFLYAGQKGNIQAQRENALGGDYAGARRV